MATARTFSRGAGINLRKFNPPSQSAARVADSGMGSVSVDLSGSVAAGGTLTGAAQVFNGTTQRIYAAGQATAPGTLFIETSSDGGATWPNSESEFVPAHEYVTADIAPVAGANRYRLRFVAGAVGVTKLDFVSQAR